MVLSHAKLKRKRREETAAMAASGPAVPETPSSGLPGKEVSKKAKRRKKNGMSVSNSGETAENAENGFIMTEGERAKTAKVKKRKKRQQVSESGNLVLDEMVGKPPYPADGPEDNAVDLVEARTRAASENSGGKAEQPVVEKNGVPAAVNERALSVREQKGKKKGGRDRWGAKISGALQANVSHPADTAALSEPSKSRAADEEAYDLKKVYVGGLPYYTTEDDIYDYFSECGIISELDSVTFPDTGKFRGIVFITFKTEDGAGKALEYDGADMGGRFLKIERCKLKPPPVSKDLDRGDVQKTPGYTSAYIGNLYWDITEDDIRRFLKNSYSNSRVDSIRFSFDKLTGDFKGFGHVDFGDDESLEAALKLNQKPLMGRPFKIAYALARTPSSAKHSGHNSSGNGNGNDSKGVVSCYNCGEEGHKSFACPKKGVNGGVRPESVKVGACYSCGEEGHKSFLCPKKGHLEGHSGKMS